MAKIPYQMRIEPELLEELKLKAKKEKRSVNNMAEVLIEYGLEVFNQKEQRLGTIGFHTSHKEV